MKSVQALKNIIKELPTLVIFGQDCYAKAYVVNYILCEEVLPLIGMKWQWVINTSYFKTLIKVQCITDKVFLWMSETGTINIKRI